MTIQQFIEKVIEGGYPSIVDTEPPCYCKVASKGMASWLYAEEKDGTSIHIPLQQILLDPLAWKAVGKVEGWEIKKGCCNVCGEPMMPHESMFRFHGSDGNDCPKPWLKHTDWKEEMHRMIDALSDGKTIEQFIKTL